MATATGSDVSSVTAICLQVLQLAKGTISAVLQTAVKVTYRLLWPQLVKSLAGEVVLVCTCIFFATLGTARVTLD
jgi:hypothetical protein